MLSAIKFFIAISSNLVNIPDSKYKSVAFKVHKNFMFSAFSLLAILSKN
ncbi:hypothetical protein [Mycoplasma phocoeninasale]|uniref:Uncharacterized protein n=1 Tax=Mycoplasma phocoeninasale TaxID=2726117 RepID=A0A858U3G8_9MOLU|nr:hypothetical protein [Mycoplasma phocoeninasale]MBN0970871.1 hypothetical protein [Mycoplasma phocoeninasale]QJG66531.1 hypothetical protein HGG64_02350 [Mycoplasma phocoeninasale]